MRIVPNTAAERMGLQRRDRIVSLNGEPIRSVDDFISEIQSMSPGQSVELQITRNGNERTIRGELAGFSESVVQTQGPSGTRGFREFRSYIAPGRSNSDQGHNEQEGYARDSRENMQTSYNERDESSGRSQSGDLESRISRIEQQIDRLTEQVNRLNSQDQSQSAQRNVPPESGTR
jgi:membrane-associated protease RseP (regulator of RpoE activity)